MSHAYSQYVSLTLAGSTAKKPLTQHNSAQISYRLLKAGVTKSK